MANVNRTSGLSPVKYLNGAPWNGQANLYWVDKNYGTALAIGDPVISDGNSDARGIPGINLAAAGHGPNPIRGVIVSAGGLVNGGFMADPTNLGTVVIPATKTKDYYVMVVDDPNVIFEVTEVSGGTQFVAADVGLNADLKAGTNNGYVSGWVVDNANKATTATYQVRLLGLVQKSDNAFGAYARWLVMINQHELGHGTGQVGV